VALGKIVFIKQNRPSTDLAHHQILPADIAEVSRYDASAVPVIVGSAQVADIEKIASLDIEIDPLAFIAAQVMVFMNIPGILDPKFAQFLVEFAGLRYRTVPITWL
jgi:hypothetical protein